MPLTKNIKFPRVEKGAILRVAAVVLLTAILVGATVASVRHYATYRSAAVLAEQQKAAEAAAVVEKEKAETQARIERLEAQYLKTRLECERGIGTYSQTSRAYQRANALPSCGPAVVQ